MIATIAITAIVVFVLVSRLAKSEMDKQKALTEAAYNNRSNYVKLLEDECEHIKSKYRYAMDSNKKLNDRIVRQHDTIVELKKGGLKILKGTGMTFGSSDQKSHVRFKGRHSEHMVTDYSPQEYFRSKKEVIQALKEAERKEDYERCAELRDLLLTVMDHEEKEQNEKE